MNKKNISLKDKLLNDMLTNLNNFEDSFKKVLDTIEQLEYYRIDNKFIYNDYPFKYDLFEQHYNVSTWIENIKNDLNKF